MDEIKTPLDPDQIARLYEGFGSLSKVVAYLASKGILSQSTKRPFSRQAIYLVLHKTELGRKLLKENTNRPKRTQ